jgi:hypothetical protein
MISGLDGVELKDVKFDKLVDYFSSEVVLKMLEKGGPGVKDAIHLCCSTMAKWGEIKK